VAADGPEGGCAVNDVFNHKEDGRVRAALAP
jgi:hypothetical protein